MRFTSRVVFRTPKSVPGTDVMIGTGYLSVVVTIPSVLFNELHYLQKFNKTNLEINFSPMVKR